MKSSNGHLLPPDVADEPDACGGGGRAEGDAQPREVHAPRHLLRVGDAQRDHHGQHVPHQQLADESDELEEIIIYNENLNYEPSMLGNIFI